MGAGIILAIVYNATKDPIEQAQKKKNEYALAEVLPDLKGKENVKFEKISRMPEDGKDSIKLHMAYVNEEFYGAAVETYTYKAYEGHFTIMVGFAADGTITGTEVLKQKETPGLGDKIDKKKDKFPLQFVGENPGKGFKLKTTKDFGDVDAITAATITSRAFCDAVQRAYDTFIKTEQFIKAKEENNYE